MAASNALVWSLLPFVFVSVAYSLYVDQQVLNVHTNTSTLRRVVARPSDGWNVHALVAAAETAKLDIWQIGPSYVDVYLPTVNETIDRALKDAGLSYTDSVIPEALTIPSSLSPGFSTWNLTSLANTTFHESYHSLADIHQFVHDLLEQYPDFVSLVPIGHSSENREMFALEISKDKSLKQKTKSKKPGFVITGAQHAREWIATSTILFLTHAILAPSSESYSLASLLNSYDFHIILTPNPDGYAYTWEHDRFWYKNRQSVGPADKCVGIDMNRNWGHKWKPTARFPEFKKKKPTGPADPCSHWYPGHRPFEAAEVNNIANYVTTRPNLQAFIDLRSYGQMVTSPFSYSCKKYPKDAEDQVEAALGATRAIKVAHGTTYTTGSLCEMTYKAGGNIVDYMYAKAGIKYSYAVHLRDTGTYGFVLPPEWIRPVGEETANMIKSLAGFIAGKKF